MALINGINGWIDYVFSCRKTQGVFDKCVKDNLNIDRPEYGYFTRAKVSFKKYFHLGRIICLAIVNHIRYE